MTIGPTTPGARPGPWRLGVAIVLAIVVMEFGVMMLLHVPTVPGGRAAPNPEPVHVTAHR